MNICKQCGNEFKPSKNTTGNFCSQDCEVKYRFAKKHIQYELGKLTNIKTIKNHFISCNEYKCAICGLSSWNNKDIVLILDHIDGNPDNNNPSNLRLVCPNCDSQLPTFKSKNKGNGRAYRRLRYKEGKSY